MAVEVFSPETVYVTKPNVKYPGSQVQATAAEAVAQTRLNDALSPLSITVPAGSIKIAN